MTNTTKLAEKARIWIGLPNQDPPLNYDPQWQEGQAVVHMFFEDKLFAPHFAHLAKREMEKRGFEWSGSFTNYHTGESLYEYQIYKDGEVLVEESECMDENEYIALWLAIEKTGVMG